MTVYTDLQTWLLDDGYDRIFRMLEYRKMFTPYEQQQAFSDDSEFKDNQYTYIKIQEVIELPNGEIMIGYREIVDCEDLDKPEDEFIIQYRRLSEIQLSYFPSDMKEENWVN